MNHRRTVWINALLASLACGEVAAKSPSLNILLILAAPFLEFPVRQMVAGEEFQPRRTGRKVAP
jgi:hypothetical protein